jgi:hypothetical protein
MLKLLDDVHGLIGGNCSRLRPACLDSVGSGLRDESCADRDIHSRTGEPRVYP